MTDHGPVLSDFALGTIAADDADRGSDIVELLFSLSALVGEETAVGTAVAGMGRERIEAALPYLQVPAVSPSSRRLVDEPKALVSAVAAELTKQTGVEVPKPIALRG